MAADSGDRRLGLAGKSSGESKTLARLIAPLAGGEAQQFAKQLLGAFGTLQGLLRADLVKVAAACSNRQDIARQVALLGDLVRQAVSPDVAQQQAFQTPDHVLDYLALDMVGLRIETLRVLFLDCANRLIADEVMAQGTIASLHFHPREIIRHAMACDASGLILVHNHPSGSPEPSAEDVRATRVLASLGKQLGVVLHDHLIVAPDGWCSMKSEGHV